MAQKIKKIDERINGELQDIRKEIVELKSQLTEKADLERLLNLEKRVKDIEMILTKAK